MHLNRGEIDKAIECFERAIQLDRSLTAVRSNLAKAYVLQNNLDKALEVYDQLEREAPTDASLLTNKANILIRQQQWDLACDLLTKAIRLDPGNPFVYNSRGMIRLIQGRLNEAISDFRKALISKVRFVSPYNNLGVCYAVSGSDRKAIRNFKTALAIDKRFFAAKKNLAAVYQGKGDHPSAISVMEEYVKENDDDIEGHEILAYSYINVGDYQRCLKELKRALVIAGQSSLEKRQVAHLYSNTGVVYHELGDIGTARGYYEECLKLHEAGSPVPFHNLINLHFGRRGYGEAKDLIEMCLALFPGDPQALFSLGRYHFANREYGEAVDVLDHMIRQAPQEVPPYALLSFILSEITGDYDKAIDIVLEGLKHNPGKRSLINNLAYSYLMKGDSEIQKAREILDGYGGDEDDVHMIATRGLLLIKEGDLREGARLYNRVAKLARTEEMKGLAQQKKNLELGRYRGEHGNRGLAIGSLKKALSIRTDSPIYRDQAKALLDRALEP